MLFTAFSGSFSTAGTSDYIQDLDKTGRVRLENFTLQKLAGLVLHVQKDSCGLEARVQFPRLV